MRVIALCACAGAAAGACPGQTLAQNPADPGAYGPWAVGVRKIYGITERNLTLTVYYPAAAGSEEGAEPYSYDVKKHIPPKDAAKITEAVVKGPFNRTFGGLDGAARAGPLPIDDTHGPYPVAVMVHGTAAWGDASMEYQEHWASRGFVVAAADYPGITLKDMIGETELKKTPKVDQPGDTRKVVAALQSLSDARLGFLTGRIDATNLGILGHSAGAMALKGLGDIAKVLAPLAGGGVDAGAALRSVLVAVGRNDSVVGYNSPTNGFASSPKPKRFLSGNNMGHMAFTDLCSVGADEGGIASIAQKAGMWQGALFKKLCNDGCSFADHDMFAIELDWALYRYATAAVLEETLMCDPRMTAALAQLPSAFPDPAGYVALYEEELS